METRAARDVEATLSMAVLVKSLTTTVLTVRTLAPTRHWPKEIKIECVAIC
jgi:hypothetical protein